MKNKILENQLKLDLFDDESLPSKLKSSSAEINVPILEKSVDVKEGVKEETSGSISESNLPDEPDYHMGYWVKKKREKESRKKSKKENIERAEVPIEIWEELKAIGKIIENGIMSLSGTNDVYKAGSHSWIKDSAQRLRHNNNSEDANELLRLRGALTRARYCRKLLNEGNLKEFISYMKDLPLQKGSSCSIILNLVQYDRLLKIIKNLE